DAGPARPVRLLVARAVVPETAGHARQGRPDDELADGAADRRTGLVDHVGRGPDARAGETGRLDGAHDVPAHDPARHLRPARVVDDRAAALADLVEVPPPRFRVPGLARGAEDPQRRAVVGTDGVLAVGHQRADD